MTKLFTKSAFKQALFCQTSLYYYNKDKEYSNQNCEDSFLQSLAEGGFQVGELAKIYYDIDKDHDIKSLGYEESLDITRRFFESENVNIAEAAFKWKKCFVRTDILVKDGDDITIVEVKAKSWDTNKDSFMDKDRVRKPILEYVYDVAFQKYVVTNSLSELYPNKKYNVKAYLMLADKGIVSDADKMNQLFIIKTDDNGRKYVERLPGAEDLTKNVHLLRAFDEVDGICDRIIAGDTAEQKDILNACFKDFVEESTILYCGPTRKFTELGDKCFKCPFRKAENDLSGMKDGYKECWVEKANFKESDFEKPLLKDLWGAYIQGKKNALVKDGKYFLENITQDDLKSKDSPKSKSKATAMPAPGLTHLQRKMLQIGMWTDNEDILAQFSDKISGDIYLDKDGLRKRMDRWQYPLHMIDFETTNVALPFYKGMRPYEQVAFQFSHHIIRKKEDGTFEIEHNGQFLNVEKGHFPNFDFVRALKDKIDEEPGTVFRYSNHENNILREIARQLEESTQPDKEELIEWIKHITLKDEEQNDLKFLMSEDLFDIVKRYYYHKSMKGCNSIKVVLPAVLNSSKYIQNKYSKPIYGSEIKSMTYTDGDTVAWVKFDPATGLVENPYKHLPPVGEYIGEEDASIDYISDDEDMTIANGGAALTAYSKLQFCDAAMIPALSTALLRYCELDTMSMVFIWEYFNHEVYGR